MASEIIDAIVGIIKAIPELVDAFGEMDLSSASETGEAGSSADLSSASEASEAATEETA